MKLCVAPKLLPVAVTLVMLPGLVLAHHFMENQLPQTFAQGFLSGLAHPVIGVDHLAFIIATGFVLALVKRGVLGIIAFMLGSLLGAALHLTGFSFAGNELLVPLSVILIGGVVLSERRIALSWLAAALVFAGVLHGYAYAESIFGAEPMPLGGYLVGFSSIQLAVGVGALVLHRRLIAIHPHRAMPISRAFGAVVGIAGMVFLASNAIA